MSTAGTLVRLLGAVLLAMMMGANARVLGEPAAPSPAGEGVPGAALDGVPPVKASEVEYFADGVALEGYLVMPPRRAEAAGPAPGVLIVHQWTGISDHEREVAHRLAGMGYVAFCADIYGKGVRPEFGDAAAAESRKYRAPDRTLFRERLAAGLNRLCATPGVDASRVAAIGYCFGGTGVLELARDGSDVRGVVSFHGGLDSPNPADGAKIQCKVLLLHGASDPFVKAEDLAAVTRELTDNRVDWQMVSYGNQVHSFTDREAAKYGMEDAVRYDERTDRRSWEAMRDFLAEVLK